MSPPPKQPPTSPTQPPLSKPSPTAHTVTTPRASYTNYSVTAAPAIAVSLGIKRLKLVLLALVAIGVVAASVIFFRDGVVLKTVDLPTVKTEANEQAQSDLIDRYNSYTGNAAAAVTKPIEAFATMALQLVLLRFAAQSMLQPGLTWRFDKLTALAAWVLLYLLLNGFNSLNVQLRPQRVIPVIRASDLSIVATATASGQASEQLRLNTNLSYVVPETTPGNLVTNTVLRTAVVSREWLQTNLTCNSNSQAGILVPEDGVEFGFPTRSWLGKMLPAAPATRSATLSLTTTNKVDAAMLPMNASRAALLMQLAVHQSNTLLGWFQTNQFNVTPVTPVASMVRGGQYDPETARVNGLLPPKPTGSEALESEWLLREAPRLLKLKFAEKNSTNGSTELGLSLSFSRVQLTPRITFDAVTFDASVRLDGYTTGVDADGKTRYSSWFDVESTCGPPPASLCTVSKKKYGPGTGGEYDIPSQILGGALCLNEFKDDLEDDRASFFLNDKGVATRSPSYCSRTSTNAMVVVSVAKRIVADSVIEARNDRTKSVSGLVYPVLVNARKVYSITVGRLGWATEDLAAAFGAECDIKSANACKGLQFPLTGDINSDSKEMLVAGVDALPIDRLGRIHMTARDNKYTRLVSLHEPPRSSAASDPFYDAVVGDVLLPHNFVVSATRKIPAGMCSAQVESRLRSVLTNHLYMENGLQPAYTSALFWLFQNGVVKAIVNASADASSSSSSSSTRATTLQFDGNIQVSALIASIPALNVWLSLAGCVVLALCVVGAISYTGLLMDGGSATTSQHDTKHLNGMAQVADPRVIAQVMLDESRFPPLFLNRNIVDTTTGVGDATIESFQIASMTLEGEALDGSKKVVTANKTSAGAP